jgi:hypothetical protein
MNGRRGAVRLCAAVVAMFDAVRRICRLVFGSPQPIEWWLLAADLAIVFLIIWLDVPEKFHKYRVRKRKEKVFECWATGQTLQTMAPVNHGPENTASWLVSFKEWNNKTHDLLQSYSPEAAVAFFHETGRVEMPEGAYDVVNPARVQYRSLLIRLNNLKTIMENADGYL